MKILCLGDSLTYGYDVLPGERWATLVAAAGRIQIMKDGVAADYSEEEATKILSEDAVTAIADVKMGDCTATAWGCDLTYDYIKINADYRS